MAEQTTQVQAWPLLADLLSYPHEGVADKARHCATLLREQAPEAAAELDEFAARAAGESVGRLGEIYTATFDLQPTCYPYVGYQLFGESYKRAALMIKLQEEYAKRGFAVKGELPDHVAVVLRFLSGPVEEELRLALVEECLLPTLEKMKATFAGPENPYGAIVRALAACLAAWFLAARPEAATPAG